MIFGDGRPIRFLGLVAGGWVGLRIALVWQATGSLPHAIREVLPLPHRIVASASPGRKAMPWRAVQPRPSVDVASRSSPTPVDGTVRSPPVPPVLVADPVRVQLALLALTRVAGAAYHALAATPSAAAGGPPALRPRPEATGGSPLSVSSWMIARGGGAQARGALSPQLGGSQGGIRVDYAVSRQLAVTARATAPAAGIGRELSVGIAWRPAGVPLRFVAEHRLALDGGRSGPALGVSGGVSELPLPAGFRLDGYGQAGAVLRDGIERYVDASVRAARPIATVSGVSLDVGGGAWGGAQRGVARLDIGPSVGLNVPLGERRLRLSLDWRQRVAGNARPGSGPALSLGTDF